MIGHVLHGLLAAIVVAVAFLLGGVTENCFTWALRQRLTKGGRLLVRRSHFADGLLSVAQRRGPGYWLARQVPHFLWADERGDIWQYTVKPAWEQRWRGRPLILAWLALWFYDGQVVQGDSELGATMAGGGS